jgi:hypothetical protein
MVDQVAFISHRMEDKMNVAAKYSKFRYLQKVNSPLSIVLTLFLIISVSPLVACTPLFQTTYVVSSAAKQISNKAEVAGLAVTSLTFISEADAQVNESGPGTNNGNSTFLQVDGATDPDVESFIRFTVSGVSGGVQNAQVRVYDTTNASTNGPAIYATGTSWTETGITWNNRPARTSGALDNKGSISTSTWAEYDVTAWVTGNGTFSFVLAADSTDAATFSSRQGVSRLNWY